MKIESFMWECNCGNVEYGKDPPQECEKCWEANNFIQVPEDMIKNKEEKMVAEGKIDGEDINEDEEDEE